MTNVIYATFLLSFTLISLLSPSKGDAIGFSIDLIHRDSHASPFYDPSKTHLDRLHETVRQSNMRANHFASTSKNAHSTSSPLIPSSGKFLMKISLGTPPISLFAIADTGSDITWVQCAPCSHCYKQKQPLFDSKNSSTYKIYPYESNTCQSLEIKYRSPNDTCEYEADYPFDYSRGALASETLTLGSNSSRPSYFPGFTFGCGFDNRYFDEDESGLVGLGGGPMSLVSQIKPSINGMFSYCLTPSLSQTIISSQINFGNNAKVSGTGVASTPIIPKEPKTYYYLNLEALWVGKHKVEFFNSSSDSIVNAGNIVIDTGSTYTYLSSPAYKKFVHLVRKAMGSKTIYDSKYILDLCYRISDKPSYPKIQAQFTSASIDLKPINTFVQVDKDVTCLAVISLDTNVSIFGAIMQTNFLVGYDTIKGTVSFKPAQCGIVSH